MAEKTEIQKAYSRGYWAGSNGKWPEHKPPLPPRPLIADALRAAISVRDALDGLLSTFEEDGEQEQQWGKYIDAFDASMYKVTEWLSEPPVARSK